MRNVRVVARLAAVFLAFSFTLPLAAANRTFDVVAAQWEFSISPQSAGADIVVDRGDVVTLRLVSADVNHGFQMSPYVGSRTLNQSVQTVTFTADTEGDFVFFCTVSTCGEGHTSMTGTMKVRAAAAFSIAAVNPAQGPTAGGTTVTITGEGFQSGALVSFGGVAAGSVNVQSAGSLTAVTPAHAAGAVDVVVTNPGGATATSANAFTYVAPAFTVSSASPSSGPTGGGTTVTISGSGFAPGAGVSFGGIPAQSVTFVSASSLTAVTPAHGAGAVDVTVTNPGGASATLPGAFTYVVSGPPALLFHPIAPCRAHDTRGSGGPLTANSFRAFQIAGRCGVPASARAVSANFTVTNLTGVGFLSIYTESGPLPRQVSTLNFDGGRWALANAAFVPLRPDGGLTAFAASSNLDLIIDVNGYFSDESEAGGLYFRTVTPCRAYDSRGEGGILAEGVARTVPIAGRCGIPLDAAAVSANATVTELSNNGYIRIYPEEGAPTSENSVLNFSGDQWALANAFLMPLRTGGLLSVMANISPTQFIADVNGYFTAQAPSGLKFYSVEPCRVFDTRETARLEPNSFRAFQAGGRCGVPTDAFAVSGNFTVTNIGGVGYLSIYTNDGGPQQAISTLNYASNQWALANAAIVPLRTGGLFNAFAAGVPVDLLFDVNGYFK